MINDSDAWFVDRDQASVHLRPSKAVAAGNKRHSQIHWTVLLII
jgi:hypothetical protein